MARLCWRERHRRRRRPRGPILHKELRWRPHRSRLPALPLRRRSTPARASRHRLRSLPGASARPLRRLPPPAPGCPRLRRRSTPRRGGVPPPAKCLPPSGGRCGCATRGAVSSSMRPPGLAVALATSCSPIICSRGPAAAIMTRPTCNCSRHNRYRARRTFGDRSRARGAPTIRDCPRL